MPLPKAKETILDVVSMVLFAPVASFTTYPDHEVPDGNPLSDTDTVKVDEAKDVIGIIIRVSSMNPITISAFFKIIAS